MVRNGLSKSRSSETKYRDSDLHHNYLADIVREKSAQIRLDDLKQTDA